VRRRRRPDELESLRRALREGKHVVDLDRLAEKLVDHERSLRAMISAVTGRGRDGARRRRAHATGTTRPRR
jgi:hypothetical protein